MASSFESRIRFQQIFWFGAIGLCAMMIGFYLASNIFTLAFALIAIAWLFLLPYHGTLAAVLSLSTYTSALILPYFPGRPYMWEFAALLGWSGLIITVSLRKYSADTAEVVRRHRWLFIGIIGYCTILMITMFYRGFGLRIFGSEQMGGRFYFQQFSCAIFPLLFIMLKLKEKVLIRLFIVQCLLTVTFFVSDFVFASGKGASLWFILNFFELPGDAASFERMAQGGGIRRYQSLNIVSQGLIFLILVFHNLRDYFSRKGIYLIPLTIAFFAMGLLSGHRYLSLILVVAFFFIAFTQRFYRLGDIAMVGASLLLGLVIVISNIQRMPLSAQRALSYIPGVKINSMARSDSSGTLETRRLLRDAGFRLMPQYYWMGRGFGMPSRDFSHLWDPTQVQIHVNQGRFYNGFIGLMVNTGLFGTIFMGVFLGSGSLVAWRLVRYLRVYGVEDHFSRVTCIVTSSWMANIIAFVIFHGDAEYAMKTFSLQAGMMLACRRNLMARLLVDEPSGEAAESVAADPASAPRLSPV
jgi:hypothetical protein